MLKELIVLIAFLLILTGITESLVMVQKVTDKQMQKLNLIMEIANETN